MREQLPSECIQSDFKFLDKGLGILMCVPQGLRVTSSRAGARALP